MFKSLLARTLLILLSPLVLVQVFLFYLIFDRHLDRITQTAAEDVSGQIALIVSMHEKKQENLLWVTQKFMNINLEVEPPKQIKKTKYAHNFISNALGNAIEKKIHWPFELYVSKDLISVNIITPDATLKLSMSTKKFFRRTTRLIVMWSVISAVVFFLIAAIFMRNQITPIKRLVNAFDRFGKTQEDFEFTPKGAYEIKKAGYAFNIMKKRLTKALSERMEALAGFSHDLRTPLSRMKFSAAMLPADNEYVLKIKDDIKVLENITSTYLDFARFSLTEEAQEEDVGIILENALKKFKDFPIHLEKSGTFKAYVRPQVIERVFDNIVTNSEQYAHELWVNIFEQNEKIIIHFDDDGPGIPAEKRADVFKPFYRIDTARPNTQHVGLGLNIVYDGVVSHGGNVRLDESQQKGLRVILELNKL